MADKAAPSSSSSAAASSSSGAGTVPVPAPRRARALSGTGEEATRSRSIKRRYVSLTSHPNVVGAQPIPLAWGELDPKKRGPVVCSVREGGHRNAIGAHGGPYGVFRALSIAAGVLDPEAKIDLTNTHPAVKVGPYPQWAGDKIVTLDPFGADVISAFPEYADMQIMPTIAITRARIDMPEIHEAVAKGRLVPDGSLLLPSGSVNVTKIAIEPVWYLPGVAERLGVPEAELRELLFTETNGSYPELITRTDLKVFLPPVGGITVYIFGDPAGLADPSIPLTARVHDECNGSDVFGSDICTCRPYLVHAIEEAVKTALQGGRGLISYARREGRGTGEVTKFLIYQKRKRSGDSASDYFKCASSVAGVEDARFQDLMPDVLHYLGIRHIHRFVSMSNMKYDAIIKSGITIGERVPIPAEYIPADAHVEIDAKVAKGYEGGAVHKVQDLSKVHGRSAAEFGTS